MASELTFRQKKQLEKQVRRKKYADLAIQGTNNSSIASKRSVELLYFPRLGTNNNVDPEKPPNEYFKYFVNKSPKRSPCINRGYWLRLHAIRSRLDSIVAGTEKKIVVVNLGCGFDPLPFQLLDPDNVTSSNYNARVKFLDIDYSELIATKVQIIKQSDELTRILGPEFEPMTRDVKYSTNKYTAASCNLNYPASLNELMNSLGLADPNLIKIFVAEVSLAYMKPEHADAVVGLCGQQPNSHFIMLEQMVPAGESEPFAKQMLKHFRKNNSPLLSVLKYQTLQSQLQRFKNLGFSQVNAGDMFQLWESVSQREKASVQAIELFDELEEFHLFCHHYLILHATNNLDFRFTDTYRFHLCEHLPALEIGEAEFNRLDISIDRKFGSLATIKDQCILYFGGSNPSRLSELIKIDPENGHHAVLETFNDPPARMCHTFTGLGEGQGAILIGGRKSPDEGFSDIWLFDSSTRSWTKGPDLPEPRYRHSSCRLENDILIHGGNTAGSHFLVYKLAEKQIKKCVAEGMDLKSPLISATVDYCPNLQLGVIVGGSSGEGIFSDSLYLFTYKNEKITILKKISHPLLQRHGAKAKFINDHEVLVVGGTSPNMVFGETTSIIVANFKTGNIRGLKIPSEIWQDDTLFLVGFELVDLGTNEFLITGGGATCYGFGAVANKSFKIKLKHID